MPPFSQVNHDQTQHEIAKLRAMVLQQQLTDSQWLVVSYQVARIVQCGVQPSSIALRDILLPHFEQIPEQDGYRKEFEIVLRYVEEFMATQPSGRRKTEPDHKPHADVLKVRSLLQGGKIVMICGVCKPEARERIKKAFGLQEVLWESITFKESKYDFVPLIRTEGVRLVVLALKHCRTLTKELKPICNELGIPFLMLTAGYSPQQLAHRILAQCCVRLSPLKPNTPSAPATT